MSKHISKEIKKQSLWKRIKNEIKVTHWPKPKKALKELGIVCIISLLIMIVVMLLDNGWGLMITTLLK